MIISITDVLINILLLLLLFSLFCNCNLHCHTIVKSNNNSNNNNANNDGNSKGNFFMETKVSLVYKQKLHFPDIKYTVYARLFHAEGRSTLDAAGD